MEVWGHHRLVVLLTVLLLVTHDSQSFLQPHDFSMTCKSIEKQHEHRWFLYTYEPLYDGCTLKCIFLEASTPANREYFDKTVIHPHYFRDGEACGDQNRVSSCAATMLP